MNRKYKATLILIVISLLVFNFSLSALGNKEYTAEPIGSVSAEQPKKEASEASEASYPPKGWVTNISDAYKMAQADDKQILLNFTGSDWCVWCKKLSKEVFTTDEFQEFADKNLVLLFLDFPGSIELSEQQVYHNQLIAQLMGVQGYPSIWLLDKDFNPIMVTGYREGGAGEYIRHLMEDLPDVSTEERNAFRISFTEAIEANLGSLK